jgi:hypothetical protein
MIIVIDTLNFYTTQSTGVIHSIDIFYGYTERLGDGRQN